MQKTVDYRNFFDFMDATNCLISRQKCKTPSLLPNLLDRKFISKTEHAPQTRKIKGKLCTKIPILDKMLHNAIINYKSQEKVLKPFLGNLRRKSNPSSRSSLGKYEEKELMERKNKLPAKFQYQNIQKQDNIRPSALFQYPQNNKCPIKTAPSSIKNSNQKLFKELRRACIGGPKLDKSTTEVLKRFIRMKDKTDNIREKIIKNQENSILKPILKEKTLIPLSDSTKNTPMNIKRPSHIPSKSNSENDENYMKIESMKLVQQKPYENKGVILMDNFDMMNRKMPNIMRKSQHAYRNSCLMGQRKHQNYDDKKENCIQELDETFYCILSQKYNS